MMKTHRLARVAEVIRETVAQAILFELKDPRVQNVTVTRVEVSADLQHAKVYVSVMGSEQQQNLTMHGLRSATGFLQSRVAQQLTTRYVPRLHFILDQGVKKSIAVSQLLRAEHPEAATPDAESSDESPDEITDDAETSAPPHPANLADSATKPSGPANPPAPEGAADGPAEPSR